VGATLGKWDHVIEVEVIEVRDVLAADVTDHAVFGEDRCVVDFSD